MYRSSTAPQRSTSSCPLALRFSSLCQLRASASANQVSSVSAASRTRELSLRDRVVPNMSTDDLLSSCMGGMVFGSSGASDDEEGSTAVRVGELRYDLGVDGSARQSAFSAQSDGDLENDSDEDEVTCPNLEAETEYNMARDTILLDRDEEDEDLEDFMELLEGARGDRSAPRREEEKTVGVDKKDYAVYTKLIIDQLPTGEKVVESVIGEVMESCTQDAEHLVPLARELSNMPPVRKAILELWRFLVDTLVENTLGVPNSQRAASFTKKRVGAHEGQLQAFIGNEDIFCAALCVADTEKQATRNLCGVFNTIDDVTGAMLTRELQRVNFIKVTYPTSDIHLDDVQKRVVYFIGGWLLSSALTGVKRDASLGPTFLPFVNSHKYNTAEEFRKEHPDERHGGIELDVEERNVEWRGNSLIYSSGIFFDFVVSLEVGYFHALTNPALLATFLGDLGSEILQVVSTADAVRASWVLCIDVVKNEQRRGRLQEGCYEAADFDRLFDFIIQKWHNCRMTDYTKGLSSFRTALKHSKAEMALRDKLKAGTAASTGKASTGKSSTTGGKEKTLPEPTEVNKAYALTLARLIGSDAWRGLRVVDLRESIEKCGGKAPSNANKATLQSMLRALAPGIGMDDDSESEADNRREGGAA